MQRREEAVVASGGSLLEVLMVFTRLGLTSFGGPVAHLGYFREELVQRRRWVDEATYADLVALCQFLPGPASSQVGIALGTVRAGIWGGLMAWLGFTLPSALALTAFALGLTALGTGSDSGWLQGLKVVAVAVVAQAVWGMAKNLTPDRLRVTLAFAAAVLILVWPTALSQVFVLLVGGLVGWRLLNDGSVGTTQTTTAIRVPRLLSWLSVVLIVFGLVGLPLLTATTQSQPIALIDAFFRAGSLVFGGGHVVLPLLEASVVAPGWVSAEQFMAGYGAAQAVPGPLFTFAAYLGAISSVPPNGLLGAAIALTAVFLPSFFLIWAALPLWARLRSAAPAQATLRGVNAAVVGILLAALYDPVITSAIRGPLEVAVALLAFAALQFWRVAPWIVVIGTALIGAVVLR
ncbi:chromate efflux transporter [Candidatus Chloroploca sp. M-50]|uniref:Chromate efflux transporter n=1 Tax=Candidatus Chloroploca mongolica TaxID=2528176 RepID=A0ABS4D5C1_9CHLR|nr:chromate efflux transporter [Candidatus Chloroploca mongolica]MBP1464631.1 chromate efflux transporter [Candidatus Chloroploca mongolica]